MENVLIDHLDTGNPDFSGLGEIKRSDIHRVFDGQLQTGVSVSASYPFVFLFTGDSGGTVGYSDRWVGTNAYQYSGYGGDGKSTLMASLIGALTTGGKLSDGTTAPLGNVLMLNADDDAAHAVRPRLDLHGADTTRVVGLNGSVGTDGKTQWVNLRRDVEVMRAVIASEDIDLIVIDPLSSYLPNADRNNEGDIRDALQPLQALMEETGVAVVGIMHVGKSGENRRASQ